MIVAAGLPKPQQLQGVCDVCEHVCILYILLIYKNTQYSIKKLQINSFSHSSKYINLFSQYSVLLTGTPRVIISFFLQPWCSEPPTTHWAAKSLIILIKHLRALWVCKHNYLVFLSMTTTTKGFLVPWDRWSLQWLILEGLCFSPSACWRSCKNLLGFLPGREASTPYLALLLPQAARTCLLQQGLSWFQVRSRCTPHTLKKVKGYPIPWQSHISPYLNSG